jgi:hypothetical protein
MGANVAQGGGCHDIRGGVLTCGHRVVTLSSQALQSLDRGGIDVPIILCG